MNNRIQLLRFARRKRGLGHSEAEILMESLPVAALLVDGANQRVWLANTRLTEISSHTRSDLNGMKLATLFGKNGANALTGVNSSNTRPVTFQLQRRNNTQIDVQVSVKEISTDGNWLLVSLEPVSVQMQRIVQHERQTHLLDHLYNLVRALGQLDLDSALTTVLQSGSQLLGAGSLAIYQVSSSELELHRIACRGPHLPEKLPSQDLVQLRSPQIWLPGKRATSQLQRSAQIEDYSYLASAPIGDPNAIIGLIAAADTSQIPDENFMQLLTILAGTLSGVFQHFSQLGNLQDSLDQQIRFQTFVEVGLDSIQDSIIVLTTELKIARINRSAELTLGYQQLEARNLPVDVIVIGTDSLLPILQLALQGTPTLNQENIHLYRRSGESFWARVSTLPVRFGQDVEGIILVVQDLSEQEQFMGQAEQLEQRALLGEVTAIFAHEVRNPINNISTGLQLMAYKLASDDPQQEIIARMQQDCDRLAELMKSVLSYSRPAEYDMAEVDMGLLLERLIDRLRSRMTSAEVTCHLQITPGTPMAWANARALEQVFTNLLTNAIQAMEERGDTLAVKIQTLNLPGGRRYVEVYVADNGPGIEKENLDHIFKPFFTTKASGTGLGLAITKRIITAHKGTIKVNSFPGGSVFTVQIPVAEQHQ